MRSSPRCRSSKRSMLSRMKVLVATQKPFAAAAVAGIRQIVEEAG